MPILLSIFKRMVFRTLVILCGNLKSFQCPSYSSCSLDTSSNVLFGMDWVRYVSQTMGVKAWWHYWEVMGLWEVGSSGKSTGHRGPCPEKAGLIGLVQENNLGEHASGLRAVSTDHNCFSLHAWDLCTCKAKYPLPAFNFFACVCMWCVFLCGCMFVCLWLQACAHLEVQGWCQESSVLYPCYSEEKLIQTHSSFITCWSEAFPSWVDEVSFRI